MSGALRLLLLLLQHRSADDRGRAHSFTIARPPIRREMQRHAPPTFDSCRAVFTSSRERASMTHSVARAQPWTRKRTTNLQLACLPACTFAGRHELCVICDSIARNPPVLPLHRETSPTATFDRGNNRWRGLQPSCGRVDRVCKGQVVSLICS